MNSDIKDAMEQRIMLAKFAQKPHHDIRDKCALSDTDKPLLINAILLSLLDSSTINIVSHTTEDIGELLLTKIRKVFANSDQRIEDIDNSVKYYNFLVTHTSFRNNDILRKMVIDVHRNIISQEIDYDVLNDFYTEFVSYNSMDSKSLGIGSWSNTGCLLHPTCSHLLFLTPIIPGSA